MESIKTSPTPLTPQPSQEAQHPHTADDDRTLRIPVAFISPSITPAPSEPPSTNGEAAASQIPNSKPQVQFTFSLPISEATASSIPVSQQPSTVTPLNTIWNTQSAQDSLETDSHYTVAASPPASPPSVEMTGTTTQMAPANNGPISPMADISPTTTNGRSGEHHTPQPQEPKPTSASASELTHPNGRFMFPGLSTSEQENLALDAIEQAETSIIADSDEVGSIQSTLPDAASDAGYESDTGTSGSTSIQSNVREFLYENGRRYHRYREGHYNFPNDDVEQEREDMKHAMVKLLCNQKLHLAPLPSHPQEILDVGTGTGIWAIESMLTFSFFSFLFFSFLFFFTFLSMI
jgi:hypothetical protein